MPLQIEHSHTLTPRQLQLLQTISDLLDRQSYSPTIGELARQLRISRSTAFEHIEQLLRKGLLCRSPLRARSLRPTSKAQELLSRLGDSAQPNSVEDGVPLVGRVAAGLPMEAVENTEHLSLSSHFGSGGDIFALQVSGDSMIGDGINDGDMVICRRSSAASDGQLVVAVVNNENATVKRFYRERNCVRLQPSNERYEPIYSQNCRIEGLVLGLLRKF